VFYVWSASKVKLGTSDPVGRVRIPMIYTVFLWLPLIGFTEFQSDLNSRIWSDPIWGSLSIRRESGPSDIKKWSGSAVLNDTEFHDKTLQLLASKVFGLYKKGLVRSIGFFRVWWHRSGRNQLPTVTRNKRKIYNWLNLLATVWLKRW
jgi:hypothetical protein